MSTYLPAIKSSPGSSKLVGIASLVMTGTLAGFLIVSYIPDALGVDSRVATVPFRGLMLLLLVYALYRLLDARQLRIGNFSYNFIGAILLDSILLKIHRRCGIFTDSTRRSAIRYGLVSLCYVSPYICCFLSDQR